MANGCKNIIESPPTGCHKESSSGSYQLKFFPGWIKCETKAYSGKLDLNGMSIIWRPTERNFLCTRNKHVEIHNVGDEMVIPGISKEEIQSRHPNMVSFG